MKKDHEVSETENKDSKQKSKRNISREQAKVRVYEEDKTEVLSDAGVQNMKRIRTREDDYVESTFPKQTVALVTLAIIVIASIICGRKVGEVSVAVICVIVFIELVMGFFLGNSPVFVSLLLVAIMMVIGILTKTVEVILPGIVVFLGTILTVKEKN
jgi:uncharacterized membrane protein